LSSFVHQTSAYTADAYTLPYIFLTHLIYQVTNLNCGEEPSDVTIIIAFPLFCLLLGTHPNQRAGDTTQQQCRPGGSSAR
jgi:hypothetical protein